MRNDLKTRQEAAGWTLGIMAAGVPIVVGLVLAFVMSWLVALKTIGIGFLSVRDIHATIFGWLSDTETTKTGKHFSPNTVPLAWFMAWVTAWFVYEIGEGLWALIRGFARMARPNRREEALQGEIVD